MSNHIYEWEDATLQGNKGKRLKLGPVFQVFITETTGTWYSWALTRGPHHMVVKRGLAMLPDNIINQSPDVCFEHAANQVMTSVLALLKDEAKTHTDGYAYAYDRCEHMGYANIPLHAKPVEAE